jgi:hypothetical protein
MKYMSFARGMVMMSVVIVTGVLWGCSKNSPTSDGGNGTGEIKTGPAVIYQVGSAASVAVRDTVSGMTFSFPEGGTGTLSVAPVTSAPDPGVAATKVAVSYSGTGVMEILVPKTAGDEDIAFVYTRRTGLMVDDFDGEYSWWGIAPSGEREGSVVFELSPDMGDVRTSKRAATYEGGIVLALASVTTGSPKAQRIAALRASVTQCVDWWLANLPADLSAKVRALVEGDMKYGLAFTSSGSAYDHEGSIFGPKAVIELCISDDREKAVNEHTVAHEVGHYMHHLLVGKERYVETLDRMPRNFWGGILSHWWAAYKEPRLYVTEEYAFLSDALITGQIDGNSIVDPLMSAVFEGKTPDERDFPSHEGYGVLMLGSLLRTDAIVKSHWKPSPRVSAPVVGAPVSDVLALVAKGARDANELRQVMQDYLDTRKADKSKLPAMLEPLGWSYNGVGFVKDTKGDPVKNAIVASVSKDGIAEYRAGLSTPTIDTGEFTLPRIYPGPNHLRVYWNDSKDSTDVAFTANWSEPTNKTLQMKTITIDTTPAPVTVTLTRTMPEPYKLKWGDLLIAEALTTSTITVTGSGVELNSAGTGILAPVGVKATARVTTTFKVTTVNTSNGYGAFFEVGETTQLTQMKMGIVTYGGVDMNDRRTASDFVFDFTLTASDGVVQVSTTGQIEYQRFSQKEDGSLVLENSSKPIFDGPKFAIGVK